MNYDDFLKTKDVSIIDSGFDVEVELKSAGHKP